MKIASFIAIAAMLLALCGCGQAKKTEVDTESAVANVLSTELTAKEQEAVDAGIISLDGSLPIVKDPKAFADKYGKISALIVNDAGRVVPVGELEMAKTWFEDTGIEFDWQPIPMEGAQEKINLMLASAAELPDLFWNFGDGKSGNIVVQFSEQGIFMPTEGLINNHMPNLKKILDERPSYWMEIAAPDGHTYGFPYIEEMLGLVLTGGPFLINSTWLEKVGLDMPETVDEWADALRAFKNGGDLNGNGIDDEIPMATYFNSKDTFGSYNLFYRFTGAFGSADSYCGGNAYADHLRMIDGNVTFTAKDEAFRKTAAFFNQLYSEGLIWNGSFEADESVSYKSSLIKEDVARIGSFSTWTDQEISNLDVHDEYVAVPRLIGELGMTGFENNYSELQDSSNTAITVDCEFPRIVARFVDYMVGDPAISATSNWGAIGYNYVVADDGILRTPLDEQGRYIAQVEEYDNFGTARVNSTTCRGSMIVLNEYYEKYIGYAYDAVQLLEGQKANGKDAIMAEYETVPRVLMTMPELARLAQIQPVISDIVDRHVTQWVTGGVTDESWNSYLQELDAAGVADLVAMYQAAVDRTKG
ncbi:MAG: extracellular solute-binding protein [Clostridiales bacterium]|jgi:putative aldouronate transport system substrate-binding protein|nr:extracellular solute-binding protein [Clostridiales bacterium]